MIERCIRCNEKLTETVLLGAQVEGGYNDRFSREVVRHDGTDEQVLLADPRGHVILWLRCSVCEQLRPTTRVWRRTPFDPYIGDGEPASAPAAEQERPPEAGPYRTKGEPIPWWAAALGIARVPRKRADAIRLVKARWRVLMRSHPDYSQGDSRAFEEANETFIARRRAYEAALDEISRRR